MTPIRRISAAAATATGARHKSFASLVAPLLATTALATVPGGPAHAATIVWNGTTSTDWATPGNWGSNSVPTAADVAYVGDTSINGAVIGTGVNGVAATLVVGAATAGALTISGGGTLVTDFGNVATGSGGGQVTVTGAGSSWFNTTTLTIGGTGSGSLVILNGGAVQDSFGLIGSNVGSVGSVLVNGAGSQWLSVSDLNVGYQGQGLLTVSGGGATTVGGTAYVGSIAGSDGTVVVTGVGSAFGSTGGLSVGQNGTGLFQVLAGGTASTAWGTIGSNAGSVGTALVDGAGSAWTPTGGLTVGFGGLGTLTVSNGGNLTTAEVNLGFAATGNGTAVVDGPGSQLNATTTIDVGVDGRGSLTISNGGSVSNDISRIGRYASGIGSAIVTGPGSIWMMTNDLVVGYDGQGDLMVSAGGAVASGNVGTIGNSATATGAVTVTGPGSSLQFAAGLTVGNHGSGVLTVADGATVSAASIATAVFAGSTGTINIGAAAGAPAAAPGSLNTGNIVFGLGTGSLNFNHTDSAYTFGAALSSLNATAAVNHLSGTTILTADNSGFLGTTTVSGGKLVVNNDLSGTVNVNGGALGGSGTLGSVTTGAGGTIAPGNSIGTLDLASLTFNAGSTYMVELKEGGGAAGTHNDLINAAGTVTINGGTVHVTPENGTDNGKTYTPKTTYIIITAAGGVTGAFAAVVDDYAFLDFALSYDANNVFLTSSVAATTFCLSGMTANQCAAGNAAFSVGSGAMFDALLNLSSAQAAGALDQLSGEIHASTSTMLIEDSRFPREAALNRLRLALGSVGGSKQGMAESRVSDSFAFWGQGFGSWGSFGGDGNAATMDRQVGGFFMGGDVLMQDNLRLGLMGGYQSASFDVDARTSSGKAETYTLGGYGGSQWGALGLRFGGAYGWSHVSMSRDVAFAGFTDRLSAAYDAGLGQVYGEAGYRIGAGKARFEPFANLAYVNLSTNRFTEAGGAAALTAAASTMNAGFTTLGVRAETAVSLDRLTGTVRGMAGWRHAFGDVTPLATHAFAAGGNAFTVAGVPIARDAFALDSGFDVNVSANATLGLFYGGQFGSGTTDQSIRGNFNMRF